MHDAGDMRMPIQDVECQDHCAHRNGRCDKSQWFRVGLPVRHCRQVQTAEAADVHKLRRAAAGSTSRLWLSRQRRLLLLQVLLWLLLLPHVLLRYLLPQLLRRALLPHLSKLSQVHQLLLGVLWRHRAILLRQPGSATTLLAIEKRGGGLRRPLEGRLRHWLRGLLHSSTATTVTTSHLRGC